MTQTSSFEEEHGMQILYLILFIYTFSPLLCGWGKKLKQYEEKPSRLSPNNWREKKNEATDGPRVALM